MKMNRFAIILYILLFPILPVMAENITIRVTVSDSDTGETLPYATIAASPGNHGAMTDDNGTYVLLLPKGTYTIRVSFLGYEPYSHKLSISEPSRLNIKLKPKANTLKEVTVTAKESDGLTSSSRIDREAMNHLQPTSFTDLLELIPGNISHNPEMNKANTIGLREAESSSTGKDYAISSLGTLFMVDGAPINGDANLQTVGTSSDTEADARDITNRGVDMRTISTDNIQSVEIVRGIPSAEYGNLTSGIVKIKRINTSTPLSARFKADEYSKLFSVGKGIGFGQDSPFVLNADLSYLDSKSDPRNNLENYKRLTGSLRMTMRRESEQGSINLLFGTDYTGSFDKTKIDPDLSLLKIDEYKSDYNRINFTSDFSLNLNRPFLFDDFNANFSVSYQIDRLWRSKQVAPQRASVAPTTTAPGEHVGQYLLGEYIAEYESDGRPLNLFLKARAAGQRSSGIITNAYKIGGEWSLSKNYGRGQIYDLSRPLAAAWTSRPRAYRDIPALNVLSFYAEDRMEVPLGINTFTLQAGVRSIMLPGLSKKYHIANRPYFDPRFNAGWNINLGSAHGSQMVLSVNGGFGVTTKMPTIDYLFPQDNYNDIIQLNYYDVAHPKENSLINIMTYVENAVNYDLRPARNRKWEVRIGFSWAGLRFSATYFQEHMNDGFRYSYVYRPYEYKKYDSSSINAGNLSSKPDISGIPYTEEKILDGYRKATNGTRIDKQGVEWQLSTPRWKALCTSLTVSGAWFKSTYSNSQMLYSSVADVVNGIPVKDKYVGLYNYQDGRINEQVNTNFMFDTQIPKWGLIFTTTFQFMWEVKSTRLPIDGVPYFYLDAADGELHPYDPTTLADPALQYLVKTYNAEAFNTIVTPFAGYLNIKATKAIGKHLRIALFVNRIIDCLPSYYSNGLLVRRSSNSYFGMELNVTI